MDGEAMAIMDDQPRGHHRSRRAAAETPPAPPVPDADGVYLCVLASGSSANCSALAVRRGGVLRAVLIDLGLSPRRTFKMLAGAGIGPHQIDGALVTHLDADHLHQGWRRQMPAHAWVRMHERHVARLWPARDGREDRWSVESFACERPFAIDPEVNVCSLLMSHDDLGAASFRFDFTGRAAGSPDGAGRCTLGFATDLGHVHSRLVEHFRDGGQGVDVLAIESNYCPVLQHASSRPEYLKNRIMGGYGHLSNQECVSAVMQIEPREHVVLLHLSRECNDPAIVAALHAGADYALTISSQFAPTRWVRIGGSPRPRSASGPARRLDAVVRTPCLWDAVEGAA